MVEANTFVLYTKPHNWGEHEFYVEPPPLEQISIPGVYRFRDSKGGTQMVLTKRTAPMFLPVTNEQLLRSRLFWHERRYLECLEDWPGDHRQTDAILELAEIHNIRARLASLSPQVLAARARDCHSYVEAPQAILNPLEYRRRAGSGLDSSSARLCKPDAPPDSTPNLVLPNPDFFDRSLPRTTLQLLVIWGEYGDRPPGKNATRIIDAMWKTIDWKALLDQLR